MISVGDGFDVGRFYRAKGTALIGNARRCKPF